MLNQMPVSFVSLDTPYPKNEGTTLHEVLSDSDRCIPGADDVWSLAEQDSSESGPQQDFQEFATAWAEMEFAKLRKKKKKTVLIAIAAVGCGISRTDARVIAAAGVTATASVASALTYYLQKLPDQPVFVGMSPQHKKQSLRAALGILVQMSTAWAKETHIFSPGVVPSPHAP